MGGWSGLCFFDLESFPDDLSGSQNWVWFKRLPGKVSMRIFAKKNCLKTFRVAQMLPVTVSSAFAALPVEKCTPKNNTGVLFAFTT